MEEQRKLPENAGTLNDDLITAAGTKDKIPLDQNAPAINARLNLHVADSFLAVVPLISAIGLYCCMVVPESHFAMPNNVAARQLNHRLKPGQTE